MCKLQDDPKNRCYIFLTEIHEFNSSLFFFFSVYEVDSVQEILGP